MTTTQPEALRDEYHETVGRSRKQEGCQPRGARVDVGELVSSGGRPADRARTSVVLVRCLQAIRDRAARPVKINSGYRSWARNVEVHRNAKNPTTRRHGSGQAADIEIAGLTGMQIAKLAVDSCGDGIGVGIGDIFAHIDVRGTRAKGTYFTGEKNTRARAELEAYRRNRTTPHERATANPARRSLRRRDRTARGSPLRENLDAVLQGRLRLAAKGTSPRPAPALSSGPAVLTVQQAPDRSRPIRYPSAAPTENSGPKPERPSRSSTTTGKPNPATRPGITTA